LSQTYLYQDRVNKLNENTPSKAFHHKKGNQNLFV